MLLSDYAKTYEWYSGKLSDVVRSLAFAGIAIIWIFRLTAQTPPRIPNELLSPLFLLVLTLAFDLLQYLAATLIWGIYSYFHSWKLGDSPEDPDLYPSHWLDQIINFIFLLKVISVIPAFYLIGKYIWDIWLAQ
jgi:hypothetical protein